MLLPRPSFWHFDCLPPIEFWLTHDTIYKFSSEKKYGHIIHTSKLQSNVFIGPVTGESWAHLKTWKKGPCAGSWRNEAGRGRRRVGAAGAGSHSAAFAILNKCSSTVLSAVAHCRVVNGSHVVRLFKKTLGLLSREWIRLTKSGQRRWVRK